MYSEDKISSKSNSKKKSKMDINRTRKKVSDYFIYLLVIAVVIQLVLLVHRLTQL